MIPNCSPVQTPQPKGPFNNAPPGMSQLEPQDRFEPGRPVSAPDFLAEFQRALACHNAEKARERAMAEQMAQLLQGGSK